MRSLRHNPRGEGMKYIILDETRGHVVNESEAYAEAEEYGNIDDPCRYHDSLNEAMRIAERLAKGTGHRFSLRMWPQ